MADLDKISSFVKVQEDKTISRSGYVSLLRQTDDPKVLEKFIETGGWKIIYKWLDEAKEENNISFMTELLKVYQNLPVTIELLKQNNCAKTIKQLGKIDDEVIKTLSSNIVNKWMQTIRETSDSSGGGGSSNSSGKSRKKSSNKKNESSSTSKSSSDKSYHHHSNSHHHHHSSDKIKTSNDDNSKNDIASNNSASNDMDTASTTTTAKSRPKTVKALPNKFRSTGLEEDSITPKKKGEKPSVKRASPSAAIKQAQPPEKKARTATSVMNSIMNNTSPTEAHGKVKIIPPKPRVEIYESTGFMDALTSQPTVTPVRRKRKGSMSKPAAINTTTTPTTPPSPPNKATPVPSFYKDTLASPTGTSAPSATTSTSSAAAADKTAASQQEKDDTASNASDTSEATIIDEPIDKEDDTQSVQSLASSTGTSTSAKSAKKKVQWAAEETLTEIFYFELDETERVNVNKQKNFAEGQRAEMEMERRFLMNARRNANDTMTEGTVWYRPPLISGLEPKRIVVGCNSKEKELQKQRIEGNLQPLYFSPDMIPDSPMEPDPSHPVDTEIKPIPLHDITGGGESMYEHTGTSAVPGSSSGTTALGATSAAAEGQLSLPSDVAGLLHNMAAQVQQQQYSPDGSVNSNLHTLMQNIINDPNQYNGEITTKLQSILEPFQNQILPDDAPLVGGPSGPGGPGYPPGGPPPLGMGGPPRPGMHGFPPGHPSGPGMGGRPPPRHLIGPRPPMGPPHRGHRMRGPPPPRGRGGSRGGRGRIVCHNFAKGHCRFGDQCHFMHSR